MPLCPRMPMTSPVATARLTPLSTGMRPYPARISTASSMATLGCAKVDFAHSCIVQNLADRRFHQNTALVKHRHVLRNHTNELQVVFDHDHSAVSTYFADQRSRVRGFVRRHARCRLIEQE